MKREHKRDGRHARAERTHEAIVTALLELADLGNLAPTAREIADRAGVALRSIRQHFRSREALFLAAAEAHARRRKSVGFVAPGGSLAKRVAAFVGARVVTLEETSALRRAASLEESRSAAITRAMAAVARERRAEVERTFEAELARAQDRRTLLLALDWAASGRAWDALRDGKLGVDAARAVMELTLKKLLASG